MQILGQTYCTRSSGRHSLAGFYELPGDSDTQRWRTAPSPPARCFPHPTLGLCCHQTLILQERLNAELASRISL